MGTSPDAPDIFVQVMVGGQGYADEVVDAMQDHPNFDFAVSSEIYDAIEESHPELLGRLIEIGPAAELTESLKGGLDKLASNFGVDVPDGLGDALPYVAEVVLGIKLIWGMVKTERELRGVDLTDRSRAVAPRLEPGKMPDTRFRGRWVTPVHRLDSRLSRPEWARGQARS